MLNKLVNFIYNVENNFIKLVQYYFGSPDNYVNLILLCKKFTRKENHCLIAKFCIIFKITSNFIYLILAGNSLSIILIESIKYLAIGLIMYLKFIALIYFSLFFNGFIKNIFKVKRPYIHNDKLKNITIKKDKSKSYSFPSNSIQNSYIFYSAISLYLFPNIYHYFIVIPIILLISFVKTLRALHYLHDIISSIVIGYLVIWFYAYINAILVL